MKLVIAALFSLALAGPAMAQGGYEGRGPHAVKNTQAGPGCAIFRPADLGGRQHPVILWGNGTNTSPAVYGTMLNQWASHGFIVVAAVTGQAGTGKEMLGCLDWLAKERAREGSVFKGAVDLARVGASGHSQGGTGAIMAGRDPRVVTTAPIQPSTIGAKYEVGAEAKQHGPMLLLSGGADNVADPALNHAHVFEKANVPVVWATLHGAGHFVPSSRDSGPYRQATTAWFLYQLMGDARAGEMFEGGQCGYCTDAGWTVRKRGTR
jgi:pimeloyl-ACP methyl ester carboxylesterase